MGCVQERPGSGTAVVATAAAAAAAPDAATGSAVPAVRISIVEDMGDRWIRFEAHVPGLERLDLAELMISDDSISFAGAGQTFVEQWPEVVDSSLANATFSGKR